MVEILKLYKKNPNSVGNFMDSDLCSLLIILKVPKTACAESSKQFNVSDGFRRNLIKGFVYVKFRLVTRG